MKNIFIIALLGIGLCCKAQTPVLPLFNNATYGEVEGAYYKDLDNDLNNFVGTWLYTNGTTSLKITIQKKSMDYNTTSSYYRDMLIGEYQYVENGVEKINTLPMLANTALTANAHNIVGNIILKKDYFLPCNECLEFEKRVSLLFSDPLRNDEEGLAGQLVIKRADAGAVQKIKVTLVQTGNIITLNDIAPAYISFNVPWGEYILTKVP